MRPTSWTSSLQQTFGILASATLHVSRVRVSLVHRDAPVGMRYSQGGGGISGSAPLGCFGSTAHKILECYAMQTMRRSSYQPGQDTTSRQEHPRTQETRRAQGKTRETHDDRAAQKGKTKTTAPTTPQHTHSTSKHSVFRACTHCFSHAQPRPAMQWKKYSCGRMPGITIDVTDSRQHKKHVRTCELASTP